MSQARRIKPKPVKKVTKKKSSRPLPWGLILVILVSAIVLGLLVNGAQQDGSSFGSGIKAMLGQMNANSDDAATDVSMTTSIESNNAEPKSTEKEFEFYEILPDIEQIMLDDLPETELARADKNLSYYLQAGSFREPADAEKLKASLALQGHPSSIQARDIEGKGIYYRVRLGPYEDSRKAKSAKNELQKLGIKPFVYSVKNDQ